MDGGLEHVVAVPSGQGGEDPHVEIWVQADEGGVPPGCPSMVHHFVSYKN